MKALAIPAIFACQVLGLLLVKDTEQSRLILLAGGMLIGTIVRGKRFLPWTRP
jgi:hypothetical protein